MDTRRSSSESDNLDQRASDLVAPIEDPPVCGSSFLGGTVKLIAVLNFAH